MLLTNLIWNREKLRRAIRLVRDFNEATNLDGVLGKRINFIASLLFSVGTI